jgi:hypothetical protein
LNKQYSKEDYEALVPQIIEHMKKTGEWGEFLPSPLSPFAYNETVAQEYYPLSKHEAAGKGYRWKDPDEVNHYQGPFNPLPDSIRDVDEEITKKILKCEVSGQLYRIIPQELKWYKQQGIPIPRRCPDQRHRDRLQLRNPRALWNRTCSLCAKTVLSSYAPTRPEKVLCEECYLKKTY